MLAWMSDTGMQPPSGTEKHCTKRAPQHHFPAGYQCRMLGDELRACRPSSRTRFAVSGFTTWAVGRPTRIS